MKSTFELTEYNIVRDTTVLSDQSPSWNPPRSPLLVKSSPWRFSPRKFWRETLDDLKAIRWIRLLRQISLHSIALAAVVSAIFLIAIVAPPRYLDSFGSSCTPGGDFTTEDLVYQKYNPWNSGSFFTVDIAFGSMSFAAAKGIDVVWDVGFGRGAQGLMALVAYKVFTTSLSRLMGATSVTRRTFEAVTLQPVTFTGLVKLVRDYVNQGTTRSRLTITWIILSSSFLLAFQSIASAMTGYSAVLGAFVQTDSGERVQVEQFATVRYIIHDGHRLGSGFSDEYYVVAPAYGSPSISDYEIQESLYAPSGFGSYMMTKCSDFAPEQWNYTQGEVVFEWDRYSLSQLDSAKDACDTLWHVSEYVSTYGFLALNDTQSVFNNSGSIISIDSPSLNISAIFGPSGEQPKNVPWSHIPYGYYWQDPGGQFPFQQTTALFAYQTTSYNATEFQDRGTCQQVDLHDIKYQWGFSSTMLTIFLALFLIWAIGTYAMYLDTYLNAPLELGKRDMNLNRAVLDLHEAMKKDLRAEDIAHLGDSELSKMLKNSRMDLSHLVERAHLTRRQAIWHWWKTFDRKRWLKDERWWLIAFSIFFIFFILSFAVDAMYWYGQFGSFAPWFGVVIVLICGRKHESRWIWFVACCLLWLVLDILWLMSWA